jgi:hypothetical protein
MKEILSNTAPPPPSPPSEGAGDGEGSAEDEEDDSHMVLLPPVRMPLVRPNLVVDASRFGIEGRERRSRIVIIIIMKVPWPRRRKLALNHSTAPTLAGLGDDALGILLASC